MGKAASREKPQDQDQQLDARGENMLGISPGGAARGCWVRDSTGGMNPALFWGSAEDVGPGGVDFVPSVPAAGGGSANV